MTTSSPCAAPPDSSPSLHKPRRAPLPVKNGAPLRLRVERQLGYKHAKYVMRIELVQSFAHIAGGKGGYWEDSGYQWFAGI